MRLVKPAFFAPAMSALILVAPTSATAGSPQQNRLMAAMVEWAVANCETKTISALVFNLSSMTISGSSPEDMQIARDAIRRGTTDNYPSKEAACVDLVPRLQATAQ